MRERERERERDRQAGRQAWTEAMEAKKKVPSLKLPLQHRQARGRSGALVGRAATSLRSIETHPCGRLVRPLLEGHRPALLLGR